MSIDKESVSITTSDVLNVSTGGAATRRVAKALVDTSPNSPAYSADSIAVLTGTGTGAAQDIAHGLGVVPSKMVIIPSTFAGAVIADINGADATWVQVVVTVGVIFQVIVFK